MDRTPDAWIARRTLYEGGLFDIGYVVCRPTPEVRTEVEYASLNVLALPLAGVFALHDGPRRHVIATPNHAVFISSGLSYRVSFPGSIGDECLTLRLSAEGLAKLVPKDMSREGFHASTLGSRAVLPPSAILARGLLWRRFVRNEADPLLVEELGIGLLDCALHAVRESRPGPSQRAGRKARHVERVKEAISTSPERKWTLDELSGLLAQLDPDVPFPPDAEGPRGRQGSPGKVALPDGWLDDPDDCAVPAGADLMHSGG